MVVGEGSFALLVHFDRVDVVQVVGESLVAFEASEADVTLEAGLNAALVTVVAQQRRTERVHSVAVGTP